MILLACYFTLVIEMIIQCDSVDHKQDLYWEDLLRDFCLLPGIL